MRIKLGMYYLQTVGWANRKMSCQMNKDGKIICKNYGELTSVALILSKAIIPLLFRQQNSVN